VPDRKFVPKTFNQSLFKAGRLTSVGRLMDATRLIQRALARVAATPAAHPPAHAPARTPAKAHASPVPAPAADVTDVVAKVVAKTVEKVAEKTGAAEAAPAAEVVVRPASFTAGVYTSGGTPHPYHLYIPAAPAVASRTPMPLIVLLHGCTQNATDFAQGTAMNELAEKHQCMVLYPEQTTKGNSARCWNWFEPDHQKRGKGEPGMIAGLTRKVLSGQAGDVGRVYIAGLSAGGAMASVVAGLYPELFTALGVHSGLPAGAAQDMLSAFSAMRNGAPGGDAQALPTIVFHGSADKTVHPDNGEHISQAALAALHGSGLALVKSQSTRGAKTDRSTQRTTHRDASGASFVEHWTVEAGPHAWSGGNAAGSYTDPSGPSASAAMLEFFLQHQKPARAA
jgi:poly(hydroxyalkanoate) depolymerase family esterase